MLTPRFNPPHAESIAMCGFAVIVDPHVSQPSLRVTLDKMTASISHRGPDAEGTHLSDAVAMGFKRLSILDTSPLGHQPMVSPDDNVVLVFNGEIYNYVLGCRR